MLAGRRGQTFSLVPCAHPPNPLMHLQALSNSSGEDNLNYRMYQDEITFQWNGVLLDNDVLHECENQEAHGDNDNQSDDVACHNGHGDFVSGDQVHQFHLNY